MSLPDLIVAAPAPIAALRRNLGLTQLEFGARIGLGNKASVSLLERGLIPCSLRIALAIEALSAGRIDAASLSDDVRMSRHGLDMDQIAPAPSPDIAAPLIGARTALPASPARLMGARPGPPAAPVVDRVASAGAGAAGDDLQVVP